ncbi:MAG TPA: carboxypeptidase-like regulatory domain-containing protein, partial [Saprospiraceae bacterium]|nr:carboxypeptidase-like regulatory domain-containing protein [Saprospiraceae bacterium]
MKKNLLFIAMGLLLILSSCVKDREVFIPDDGINYKSNILGVVVDESNKPAEGATVTYNGVTKTTDKNGVYTFNNVDVSSKHSLVKIKKAGYFEASRAFNTQKSANIQLRNILLAKDFNKSFSASSGGVVEANGYKITFPANAVMVESSGAAYTGQVKVAVQYLDPSLTNTFFEMPGNLSGISSKNEISKLATYGMVAVELQSTSGEKLQIKTGSQVEIVATIPKDFLTSAPANIPLWYYDETLGYWKEEGNAQLVNNTYVGKVSHFSYWNYDSTLPSINVSGKVVDANGNPIVCDISFTTPGYSGGHGLNNPDGTFSGPIGKDVLLTFNIYAVQGNCIGILYSAQVGPFSADVVLPDITVNTTTQEVFSCNGTFKDCSGNLIQNGYMKVVEGGSYYYPFYYPIVNGQASGSFTTCLSPISATVTAVNLDEI